MRTSSGRLPAIAVVYAAGFLQGLTLVSFPALSDVMKTVLGLTDGQYGAIFLPQVALAAAGAVIGGTLARRLGLRRLLVLGMAVNGLSQAALIASGLAGPGGAYAWVLAGTSALGLGFGLFGAPLNAYPRLLFPAKGDAALVAVHTIFGLGLAAGPLAAAQFVAAGYWPGFPMLLLAVALVLAAAGAVVPLPRDETADQGGARTAGALATPVLWIFLAVAVVYAFAEGTFANWAVIYLRDGKGLDAGVAGLALSVFWGAMVVGRLSVSALLVRLPAGPVWLALPLLMIAAFQLLPYAETAALGIGLFAFAGLACSAFFPLTIALVSQRFPRHVALVSALMIAALMVGVGAGSFALGALREAFSFEQLYRLSAVYPALALVLALMTRSRRPAAAVAE